ncbi:PP_RS20740 family protein [Bradyrhizobium sp. STM 3562]|uniref:PP_RS20740 family protein n=1 Tax=Bradyrhizobium sp. STM 3562 TaxID=578924 RepID=UPI00388D1DB9
MKVQGANSSTEPDDTESLASDLVSIDDYSFALPKKREFLPWHKPRKQYVRSEQWRHYIGELADEIAAAGGTLTYFGLPGDDLLDIRFFGSAVCEPRSLRLRFLGFNNSADAQSDDQTDLNISLDEVSKSASYDPQSEIVPHDIREVVDDHSIAWRKTFEIGPYDVINLDLCDGFGAQPPGKFDHTYYNMVSKLLSVQARRKTPWLLLLTTRVGKAHVHFETLDRLSELYKTNLADCIRFREFSSKKYNISDASSLQKAKRQDKGIQPVFLVGLCKWLLRLSSSQNPPSIMDVKNVLGYRVKGGVEIEDMVSIAIRFNPTHGPTKDPSNLAGIQPTQIDECALATNALKRVGNLLDVDAYLGSQHEIRNEMVNAMCQLLDAARYDIAEYRKLFA